VDDVTDIHRDLNSTRAAGLPVYLCCTDSDNNTGDIIVPGIAGIQLI